MIGSAASSRERPALLYRDIAMLVVGTAFFTQGARMDRASPILWGCLSLGAWCVTFFLFGGGFLWWILGQAGAYGLLFAERLYRAGRQGEDRG